jgi:hypothetical protein
VDRKFSGPPLRQDANQPARKQIFFNQPKRKHRNARSHAHGLAQAGKTFGDHNGRDEKALFALRRVECDLFRPVEVGTQKGQPCPVLDLFGKSNSMTAVRVGRSRNRATANWAKRTGDDDLVRDVTGNDTRVASLLDHVQWAIS